jgi:serine/threonine-protein kinase
MQMGDMLGPYQIVAKLGEGGMGIVYRAHDTRLGREVAIKVLPGILADDPDRIRRFDREARAVAALNHPNICHIHDVAAHDELGDRPPGPRYLVLEYVDGEPIAGPLPEDQAIRLALQVASALETAHRQGILHRDLKPANVLVTRAGTAKLLDFGVAKFVGPGPGSGSASSVHTSAGMIFGSAGYMSPEQTEGEPLDARSDIFSFGALLYEMLSGRPAFPGRTGLQAIAAVLTREPEPLDTSPALAAIVRRCLAKQPAERFQSATELIAALAQARDGAAEPRPSIAVLPFENLDGDRDNDYFGDGLAEEIINALAQLPGLRVIARTSAFAFKGKHEDVRRVAAALGVAHVLEGSVRRAGSRIRATAQLISAADGSHIWSERYDRELSDVFAVQDEISAAIAQALKVTLSGTVRSGARYTPEMVVYEHYLRGLYETQRWTPESNARARAHFERAIALDPRFGLPHAEFGHLSLMLGLNGFMSPREGLALARAYAQRAVEIEPLLPEGHAVLGSVAALLDYDWAGAEACFGRALAGGAVSSRVHHIYGHYYLLPVGRLREALEHQTVALNADPLNLAVRVARAVCLRGVGEAAEANAELQRLLESEPSFWFPWFSLGVHHVLEGRTEEAVPMADQAYRLAPWFKPIVGLQAAMCRRTGQAARADELLQELEREAGNDPIGPAIYHLVCGDLESTADWTARAIELRQSGVFFFLTEHASVLRSTPRWPALARLMKLPA